MIDENGKPRAAIVKEYALTVSALDRWINKGRSTEENELIALCKEIQQLKMEIDFLK
ncbi:hypothetical protein ACFSTH_14000 [Paenibacillus yanchengensis]